MGLATTGVFAAVYGSPSFKEMTGFVEVPKCYIVTISNPQKDSWSNPTKIIYFSASFFWGSVIYWKTQCHKPSPKCRLLYILMAVFFTVPSHGRFMALV
jgi:hypothetical protein